jgi:hypothetical protein
MRFLFSWINAYYICKIYPNTYICLGANDGDDSKLNLLTFTDACFNYWILSPFVNFVDVAFLLIFPFEIVGVWYRDELTFE